MSVIYDIRERFCAENFSDDEGAQKRFESINTKWLKPEARGRIKNELLINNYEVETAIATMQHQIALLCMKLLCNNQDNTRARINKFSIELDDKITEYSSHSSNDNLTVEIQEAIRGITNARKIKIDLDYMYIWRAGDDYLGIGPFVMTEYLNECGQDVFECIDYVMFNTADCSDSAGNLSVYGKRNGVLHCGSMACTGTDEILSSGYWYVLNPAITINDIEVFNENIPRVTEICHGLMELSSHDNFSIDDNFLYFELNNPRLESPGKVNLFISSVSELATILCRPEEETPEDVFIVSEFVDISENGPNIMKIEFAHNGDYAISTALAF